MNNNDSHSHFKTGDLVIGSTDPGKSVYSSTGLRLASDGVALFGKEDDIARQQAALSKSAERNGGISLQVTSGNGRKTAKKKSALKSYKGTAAQAKQFPLDEHSEYVDFVELTQKQSAPKLETVQFENDFGKIKAKVEYLVEHTQAFLLVFPDADSVVFEPKVGEMLTLHRANSHKSDIVYYPGVTFDSPDSDRKLMILFKVPEENQE
jgi:hypothetical protein